MRCSLQPKTAFSLGPSHRVVHVQARGEVTSSWRDLADPSGGEEITLNKSENLPSHRVTDLISEMPAWMSKQNPGQGFRHMQMYPGIFSVPQEMPDYYCIRTQMLSPSLNTRMGWALGSSTRGRNPPTQAKEQLWRHPMAITAALSHPFLKMGDDDRRLKAEDASAIPLLLFHFHPPLLSGAAT